MRGVVAIAGLVIVACGARTGLYVPAPASDVTDASCGSDGKTDLEVPAATAWTDTGIDVAAGTELVIHATGEVRYGGDPKQVTDPNGGNFTGEKFFTTSVLAEAVVVSLIGKVGGSTAVDTGTPLPAGKPGDGAGFVGTDYDQIVPTSGRLFLGFNDQRQAFGDNSGTFSVTVSSTTSCAPHLCDWATPFDSVTLISELGLGAELRLSQDELTGYFYRNGDIYVTRRAAEGATFDPPEVASDVSSPAFDADPFLSADGLAIYVNSQRGGTLGDSDIFVATRPTTTAQFSAATDVANVNSPAYDGTPYVTNDGAELWLASSRQGSIHLFRAVAQSGGFGAAAPVDELDAPGAQDNNPVLTADGLTVYFSSNRNGPTQVLVAHRPTLASPFAPPAVVSEISTSGSDYASWISPDSCRLYMTRGTPAGFQLYVATRH